MTAEGESISRGGYGQAYDVLVYLRGRGDQGGTCTEIEPAIREGHRVVSRALNELEHSRYVMKTPRKRKGWGGRPASVYVITPLGREDLAARERQRSHQEGGA